MTSSKDTDSSRTRTDENLRAERERSDDELLARSTALAEDAEEVIARERERARLVLELAREREDQHLVDIGATREVRQTVRKERRTADAALADERATAETQRLDERERRRAAMIQLLAFERSDENVLSREDLLALVAHDLRNMLSTIVMNASVVVMAPELRMTAAPAAQIQRVGAQMADLLDDLLAFSSFEAGKLSLSVAEVDVVPIVADAVEIHEQVAKAHGLALAMQADPPSVTVAVDGKRITRALVNLIGNALKFTPAGGRVDVSVSVIGDECEIAVADTGIGIPKDQLQSIFERFQQVGTQARRSTGVGLGLYIARLIADAHGGRIWAESEPPAGSTFRLRLPLIRSAT